MPTHDTSNLDLVLNTPLGPDELLVASFSGHEEISRLYSITLELLSLNDSIDFESIVGQTLSLKIRAGGENHSYKQGVGRSWRGHRTYRNKLM